MNFLFTKLVIGFDFIELTQAVEIAKKLNKSIPSMVIENVSNFSIITYIPKGNLFSCKDIIKNCFSEMTPSFTGQSEEGDIVKFTFNDDLQRTAQQRAQNLF